MNTETPKNGDRVEYQDSLGNVAVGEWLEGGVATGFRWRDDVKVLRIVRRAA